MTQKATVERMLDDAGPSGVRSDQFLHVNIPRAAARIEEIKKRLEVEGVGTITSTPEKQFCRYRKVVDVGHRAGGRGEPGRESAFRNSAANATPSSVSGESSEVPGESVPSLAGSPEAQTSGDARLFSESAYERLQDAA